MADNKKAVEIVKEWEIGEDGFPVCVETRSNSKISLIKAFNLNTCEVREMKLNSKSGKAGDIKTYGFDPDILTAAEIASPAKRSRVYLATTDCYKLNSDSDNKMKKTIKAIINKTPSSIN